MKEFDKLVDIIKTLRGPDGCAWDKKQTLYSMKDDFLEEAYEVVDALESEDTSNLCEELGDILLHVAMHSRIAEESGIFNIQDVLNGISDKLVRRHPHVFGDVKTTDPEMIKQMWDEIKKKEKKDSQDKQRILAKASKSMPTIKKASKLQKTAASYGFDWKDAKSVTDKVDEELCELKEAVDSGDINAASDELGDILFVLINLANHLGISAEASLKSANQKFIRRFNYIEDKSIEQNKNLKDMSLEEMELFWQQAKKIGL